MSKQASSSSVPPIRSFQFNASSAGSVKDSVNLFRGDVNLQQTLFTMPGRTEATDVEVSLLYQSNVYHDAMTFNRTAPTGVVGLGWSFPANLIELQTGPGESPGNRSYALIRNGGSNPLIREATRPFLFTFGEDQGGALTPGQAVPAELVVVFGQRGLALDPSATLESEASGALRVVDEVEQREFVLIPGTAGWSAFDGGEAYQLEQFEFWKILYYPTWERWAIIDDNGQVSSYGGRASAGVGGFAGSVGNSVEWAVAWTSATGAPLWSGPSSQAAGQRQVARAWNLASKTNLWGDQICYGYNEQWPVDSASGVRPVVEQLVCAGGQPYTKACYLTSITDVFGRRATFNYADKLWSSGVGAPREYADPHGPTPSTSPNGWQDRYETQYLASITVDDPAGARLFAVELDYAPRPGHGSGSAVANVNPAPTGGDAGDFYKRYLTAVTMTNEFGAARPPVELGYYLDATDEDGYSPGALASLTSPGGGVSRWRYTEQQLDLCDRALELTPPDGFGSTVVPRIWFADDYAVAMWFDLLSNQASLAIYTWQGRWDAWSPDWGAVLAHEPGGIDLASLEVVTGADFVAISYVSDDQRKVYLFDKDPSITGNWRPATVAGVSTGQDAPCLSYPTSYGPATVTGGASFLVIGYVPSLQTMACDRLTWRWSTGRWSIESDTLADATRLSAGADYVLALETDGSYALSYLDAGLAWQTGDTGTIGELGDPRNVAVIGGSSLVVVARLLSVSATSWSYAVTMLRWDADYRITTARFEATDSNQIDWIPHLINDTTVAVGGRIWRFDGANWLLNDALVIAAPVQGWTQRYAYGPDYAVQLYVNNQDQVAPGGARLLGYDASDSSGWPAARPVASTAAFGTNDAWPSAGTSDYLTMGDYLYYRGSAPDWTAVIEAGAPQDLGALIPSGEALETSATVNQGPAFIAFNSKNESTGASTATAAMVLGNGEALAETEVGAGMRMINATDPDFGQPGVSPAGPATLLVFPNQADSFSRAPRYTIYRYVGNELDGNIRHYGVSCFETDDGLGSPLATAICIDPSTAACDPSGTWIKYYRSLVAPGVAAVALDPETLVPAAGSTPYGSVSVRYLNGVEQVVGADQSASMLDGMLLEIEARDDQGVSCSRVELSWEPYRAVALAPADAANHDNALRLLRGGFAVQAQASMVKDGVSSSRTSTYLAPGLDAPFSNQAVTTAVAGIGTRGVLETRTTSNQFAIQLDDAVTQGVFRTLNLCSQVVETQTQWQREGQASLTTAASATTWSSWASQLGAQVQVPAQAANFAWLGDPSALEFPFAAGQPGEVQGWRRQDLVAGRNREGLCVEGRDALDVPSSTLYDASGSLPIAALVNGSLAQNEWTYLGFEAYEQGLGWTLAGTREVPGDAYFGQQSLGLAPGARVSTTVNVRSGVSGYLLGFAVKTPADYEQSAGTNWTVSYAGGGTAPAPIPITSTHGVWEFRSIGLGFENGAVPSSITIAASNGEGVEVLIDCVYLIPRGSSFSAQAYETRYGQTISGMTMTGFVTRSLYDEFRQVVGSLDGRGFVRQIGGAALSRANAADDQFSARTPNCTTKVVFADYGVCDDFGHGDEWRARWEPNDSAAWTVAPGLLVSEAGGSLRWKGKVAGLRSAGVCLGIAQTGEQPSKPIAIDFCGSYTIAWQPGVGWTADGPGWAPEALVQPPRMAGDWLLVFTEAQLSFFAGGQLIYSTPWSQGVPDDLSLIASGPLALRYLGVGGGPRLSLNYSDGNGGMIQTQMLDGGDASVGANIVDALGRTVAATKFAPASFAKPANVPILAYLEGFVDRQAFMASMADSWALSGTVADYYRGETVGGYTPSDDGGYPYTGTRYQAAPRGRKLETGLPGATTAIHDVSQPPSTRQTTSYAYASNAAVTLDGVEVAAGSYYQQISTGPLGHSTRRWRSFDRTQVAAELIDSSDQILTQTRSLQEWLAQAGRVVGRTEGLTPNHYGDSAAQEFVNTQYSNALSETVLTEVPGLAAGWSLRDAAGRIRVVGFGSATTVGYFVYDAIGRPLEFGRIDVSGDDLQDLLAAINDPNWPLASAARTPTRSFGYDGDGNTPALLGLRTQVTTTTAPASTIASDAAPISVLEQFRYDDRGRTSDVTQSIVDEPSLPSASFRYTYNNTDEIVCVGYPEGSPIAEVHYGYDDNGRVIAVGRQAGSGELGSYSYAPNGDLIGEVMGGGVLSATSSYTSQGWLASYSASVGEGVPAWTQAYGYYPDSSIQTRTDTSSAPLRPGVTTHNYSYDGRKQLASASAEGATPWSESLTCTDANGNILGAALDNVAMQAVRDPGSDRLQSVQVGDGPAVPVGHDALGHITSFGSVTTDYDPVLLVPSGFAGPGGAAVIGHGVGNQRVIKRMITPTASTRLYFGGQAARPLALWQDGRWTAAVYGPTGLLATISDRVCFPIKDNLQSIRHLIDDQGEVVASFTYSAFGSLVAQSGQAADVLPRFMGQEQDPETGYYAFLARLYDPVLRRFHGPDPQHQFPSPYVFVGNQPITNTDPTGEMAWLGLIAMSAVFAVGFGLSLATGGASDVVAADVDAVIAGLEAGAVEEEAMVEGGDALVDLVPGEKSPLKPEAGKPEAKPNYGATSEEPAPAVSEPEPVEGGGGSGAVDSTIGGVSSKAIKGTAKATARHIAVRAGGGAIMGAGENGAMFLLSQRKAFDVRDSGSRRELLRAMLIGALEGAITGSVASLVDMPLSKGVMRKLTESKVKQSLAVAAGKGLMGMGTSDVNYWISNQFNGDESTIKGFVGSAIWGGISGGGASALGEGFGLLPTYVQLVTASIGGAVVIGSDLQMLQLAIMHPNRG